MNPGLTGKAYDEILHLWASDSFNKEDGISQHKRAVAFTKKREVALDVGCGCNSRYLEYLISEGFDYEGLDVSEKTIKLVQSRHSHVVFYHEDICEWIIPKKYDLITGWDSLWHVPLVQQEQVISKLVSALNPNGVLIFSFGGLEEASEHTNELMGPLVYYSTLGTQGYLHLLENMGCILRHFEHDQHPESHAYIIAQKTP